MRQRVIRVAILLYPRAWRLRYGDELQALVHEMQERQRLPLVHIVLNLSAAAALERLRSQRRIAVAGLALLTLLCVAVGSEILTAESPPSRMDGAGQLALGQGSCNTTPSVVASRAEGTPEMSHRKRTVACAIAAIGVGVPVVGIAAADPSSTPQSAPQPPSMASSLSSQVAMVPGIVSFLESSTPKSLEFDSSSGKVVWVGSGNATMDGSGWSYPANGYTIAGAFEPNPGSSTAPTSWPTESPAAAIAAASVTPSSS